MNNIDLASNSVKLGKNNSPDRSSDRSNFREEAKIHSFAEFQRKAEEFEQSSKKIPSKAVETVTDSELTEN